MPEGKNAVIEDVLFCGRRLVSFVDDGNEFVADAKSIVALRDMQQAAADCGLKIAVCSAYRSFERQFEIFKDKFEGRRPVLAPDESVIDISALSCVEKIKAITFFSAIPGLSRHHLGTDFDLYAPELLPAGQRLQLTYHEYDKGAYFYPLGQFLQTRAHAFGFFHPFWHNKGWQGGAEPWHLSYRIRAQELLSDFSFEVFCSLYQDKHEDFVPELISFSRKNYRKLLCMC